MNDPNPRSPTPPSGEQPQARRPAFYSDYPKAALRLWLLFTVAGAAVFMASVVSLLQGPHTALLVLAAALLLIAVAAQFPVEIPRTRYQVLLAQVFVFAMLVSFGGAAAVLCAGTDALMTAVRKSRRAATRISAMAIAMAAMGGASLVHGALCNALFAIGVPMEAATVAALLLSAPLYTATVTAATTWLWARRSQQRFDWRAWLDAVAVFALMSLVAAFFAGLFAISATRFGPALIGSVSVLMLATAALARVTLQRQDRLRQTQEQVLTQAQREAERSQQRFSAAFTHAAIGMAVVRSDERVMQVNQALCQLLGREAGAMIGRDFGDLLPSLTARVSAARRVDHDHDEASAVEVCCPRPDGRDVWVAVHCSRYEDPEIDETGGGHCLIYQLHDITSRHRAEARLHHIAYHDGLTDLANRQSFHERLQAAVERSRLDPETRFAVLFLDLDRFKTINDSLGHGAGNALLREVARRLLDCVRPSDRVARLGGDEFALLLRALHDVQAGMALAQRVLVALSRPFSIEGTEIVPGASIGITFSDLGYRTADEVLRDADLAMYEAKAGGRGRVVLFDSSMHERVAQKLALEADLRRAIAEGQLSVQFQPLYDLQPFRLSGFEALTRWVHPQHGPVNPAVFIALAEESGQIEALTDLVMDNAIAHLAHWRRTLPAAAGLCMHVNISSRDLGRADLVPMVDAVLARHQVDAGALTLEITETTLMGRLDLALATMGLLRQTGVRFSIDDFGTGYSSLAYLSTLPIDSLKIDRSFVIGLHDSPQNVEIVRAVLMLAKSLGRRVIAEGIETQAQLQTLRELGVDVGQGYLLARPLHAAQVVELLRTPVPAMA